MQRRRLTALSLLTILLPTILVAVQMVLRKAGANWVEGDRFYDRESDLEALGERVLDRDPYAADCPAAHGQDEPRT